MPPSGETDSHPMLFQWTYRLFVTCSKPTWLSIFENNPLFIILHHMEVFTAYQQDSFGRLVPTAAEINFGTIFFQLFSTIHCHGILIQTLQYNTFRSLHANCTLNFHRLFNCTYITLNNCCRNTTCLASASSGLVHRNSQKHGDFGLPQTTVGRCRREPRAEESHWECNRCESWDQWLRMRAMKLMVTAYVSVNIYDI